MSERAKQFVSALMSATEEHAPMVDFYDDWLHGKTEAGDWPHWPTFLREIADELEPAAPTQPAAQACATVSGRSRRLKKERRHAVKDQLALSWSCLDEIRGMLSRIGLPMDGCPPMFYPEAINNVVVAAAEATAEWRGKPLLNEERRDAAAMLKAYMAKKFPQAKPAPGGGEGE